MLLYAIYSINSTLCTLRRVPCCRYNKKYMKPTVSILQNRAVYFIAGVLLILLNITWLLPTRTAILEYVKNQQVAALEKAETAITTFLEEKALILSVTASHLNRDFFDPSNEIIVRKILSNPEFNSVSLLDKTGKELFFFDRFQTLFSEHLKNKETSPEFISVMGSKKPFFGKVHTSEKLEPIMTVAVPVFSTTGDVRGVLVSEISTKLMFEVISTVRIGSNDGVYVTDGEGNLISHMDISLVLKNTNVTSRAIVADTLKKTAPIAEVGNGYAYINEKNTSVIPVSSYISSTGWVVVFEQLEEEAFSILQRIDIAATLSVLGGLVLLFFMGILNQSMVRARKQAEERTTQQSAVARFGQFSLSTKEPMTLMTEAVRTAKETLLVEYAKVLELAEDKKVLLLRAGLGWKDGMVGTATVSIGTESQAGFTLISRGAVTVEDFSKETRFSAPPLLKEHGIKSGITVVIQGSGKPFGVLGVHSAHLRVWSESDISFIQAIANTLSVALRRISAEEEIAKRSDEILNLNKFMIGRELKMIELKQEIEIMRKKLGQ